MSPDTSPDKAPTNGGDQRVTNATILAEIRVIRRDLEKMQACIDRIDDRQRADHDQLRVNTKALEDHDDEINKLRTKSDLWNTINSIGAALAGVFGMAK